MQSAPEEAETTAAPDTQPDRAPSNEPRVPAFEQRYQVVGEIARGGMGAVLEGRDIAIRREVAIKVMLSERADSQSMLRFIEEAQVQGQLEHPNICPVYDLGFDDHGNPYFAMKRVHGRSLQGLLDGIAAKKLDENEHGLARLLEIFSKVCDAVAFAHSRGVVHRDLKPANVMIGEFGEVLVVDWGLAKVRGAPAEQANAVCSDRTEQNLFATRDGAIMGSPSYMAPEQAAGDTDRVDQLTDVYALGGILYAILTLRSPIAGSDLRNALTSAMLGRIEPPSRRAPHRNIPPDLEACAMKALSHDPQQRYSSARELREEVSRFLEGRTLRAARYTLSAVIGKWVSRNRALAITSAVGLSLLAATLAIFVAHLIETRRTDRIQLAEERLARADALALAGRYGPAKSAYDDAKSALSEVGKDTLVAELGRWDVERIAPRPLYAFAGGEVLLRNEMHHWKSEIAVRPDGKELIAIGKDGLSIWDVATGRRLHQIAVGQVFVMSLAPDGRTLHYGQDGLISYDLEERRVLSQVRLDFPRGVGFLSDRDPSYVWVATATNEIVRVRADTGAVEAKLAGHNKMVWELALSPDGSRLASLSPEDHELNLWDVPSGAKIRTVSEAARGAIQFAADGSLIFSKYDGSVAVESADGGTRRLSANGSTIAALALSADGKYLATLGYAGLGAVLNLATGRTIQVLDEGRTDETTARLLFGHAIHFIPGRAALVTAGRGGRIEVWPFQGRLEIEAGNSIFQMEVVRAGGAVALLTREGTASVHDLATLEQLPYRLESMVSLSPIWERRLRAELGTPRHWKKYGKESINQAASTFERTVATSEDTLHVWSGEGEYQGSVERARGLLAAASSAELALLADQQKLSLVDLRTREPTFLGTSSVQVSSVALSSDGKLAAVGLRDGRIELFDTATRERLASSMVHDGPVASLAFSRDGRYLASGGDDRTVRLVEAHGAREIRVIDRHAEPVHLLRFTPDGTVISAANDRVRVARLGSFL